MSDWKPSASIEHLRARADWLKKARAFFAERDVLEVETPILSTATVPDPNIDSLVTTVNGLSCYLQTSPELYMKRLLAAGSGPIYQIARVFRDGESGRLHNPEFTLVEWYRPGFDQFQLMAEVIELVTALTGRQAKEMPVEYLTYQQLVGQHTNLDPLHEDWLALQEFCRSQGLECPVDDEWDVALDWLMVTLIQPAMDGFIFVYDFPASMASLARLHPDDPALAKRFELFIDGTEIANGFEELTDVQEQGQRFLDENQQRRQRGKPDVVLDQLFLHALEAGIPNASGVALGLDRLFMWSMQLERVSGAMSFALSHSSG